MKMSNGFYTIKCIVLSSENNRSSSGYARTNQSIQIYSTTDVWKRADKTVIVLYDLLR